MGWVHRGLNNGNDVYCIDCQDGNYTDFDGFCIHLYNFIQENY